MKKHLFCIFTSEWKSNSIISSDHTTNLNFNGSWKWLSSMCKYLTVMLLLLENLHALIVSLWRQMFAEAFHQLISIFHLKRELIHWICFLLWHSFSWRMPMMFICSYHFMWLVLFISQITASVDLEEPKMPKLVAETTWNLDLWFIKWLS